MIEVPAGGSQAFQAPPIAPDTATLRISGEGRTVDYAQDGGEAVVNAVGLPVGEYRVYWAWVDNSGIPHLLRTDGILVKPVEGPDQDERILAAAKDALEKASGSDQITLNVEGYSASFMSRLELLAFVNRMERKVRGNRRRAELGVTKRGKFRIRTSRTPAGVWG